LNEALNKSGQTPTVPLWSDHTKGIQNIITLYAILMWQHWVRSFSNLDRSRSI